MTAWVQTGITILAMIGGLAALYSKISARLTALETRASERDRQSAQLIELDYARAYRAAAAHCRDDCPRRGQGNTNPSIPVYRGPIAPDEV
jgi:hypothetical protein